jgi:tripartite-type tricarboxylate transporter receptor subunit TctC
VLPCPPPSPSPSSSASAAPRRNALLALASLLLPDAGQAQAKFPDRPITLLVPFGPGGIADLTARAVAEQMAKRLGQSVVVDNRPSAGSIVASQAVASARPDGHTLLLMSNGNAVSVGLFKKLPFDLLKDFAPISLLGQFDLGIFAAAKGRFATLQDVLAHARAHPGQLNIGTITPGSTQHLAAKLFETVAGIDAVVVPYKGSPAVLGALRAGEIDIAFEVLGPMLPQVAAGVVKALAVSSEQRNPTLPDVPTVQQAGVPRYSVASWNALAAPAGTPPEVIARLGSAVRDAVASPDVQARLGKLGMRLQASTPAEMQALVASEVRRWGEVVRAARIEPE